MFSKKSEVIDYINNLKGYRGYVQFSHRPLKQKDIFENSDPTVQDEEGFVYEAHFANDKNSIMIRQQNAVWVVSETAISDIDEKDMEYFALEKTALLESVNSNWVKMAQIWEEEDDKLCELEKDKNGNTTKGMKVKKLKKVVFAGFENE